MGSSGTDKQIIGGGRYPAKRICRSVLNRSQLGVPADKERVATCQRGRRTYEGRRRMFCASRPHQPPATSLPSTPTYTDMDFRKSFSKPFKKLKHRLTEGNRRPDGRSRRDDNKEGRGTNVEGGEADRRNSGLHSEVESVVESRPDREENSNDVGGKDVERVNSSTSSPSIPHGGASGSTQTPCYFNPYL